jgi:deazaflavin-dependent oxidoreductase (nitroreductase family)
MKSDATPGLAQLASHLTIDLTTVGRRSGAPSRIEIWWFHVDGRFVITGTPGRRDWYANVLANPEVVIHVAGWDLPATARPIRDPEIRAGVFDFPSTRWYSTQAQRQRLIDEAPMIEIVFEGIG